MKRVLLAFYLVTLLTIILVTEPPRRASAQFKQQDTVHKDIARADDYPAGDSEKTALTKQNIEQVKTGSEDLEKQSEKVLQTAQKQAKADNKGNAIAGPAIVIVGNTDTLTVVGKDVPVYVPVIDSAMAGKSWFGQALVHISRCRIKYLFHPKMWRKGKF